jgi:hypothetical protein
MNEFGASSTAEIIASVSTQHLRFEHLGQVENHMRDHEQPSVFSPSRAGVGYPVSSSAHRGFMNTFETQAAE